MCFGVPIVSRSSKDAYFRSRLSGCIALVLVNRFFCGLRLIACKFAVCSLVWFFVGSALCVLLHGIRDV